MEREADDGGSRRSLHRHSQPFLRPYVDDRAETDAGQNASCKDRPISDEIFVLDVGGYIGESTSREIAHAKATGKSVRYLSAEHPGWVEADAIYAKP